jgi:MYXO-CTERM domain-containing protein
MLALALLLACGVLGTAAPPAAAEFITYNLDQSNTLPNGVVYGTVKVEAFQNLGEVKLTYTADPTPYSSTGKNFGFHTVGFNTDLSLNSGQFTLPAGWTLKSNANLSNFGVFSWAPTTSNSPSPSVTVVINGLGSNATLAHFAFPSVGGKSVFFAGHVIDFKIKGSDTSSHWVGGSTDPPAQTPEPATAAMAAIGLAGLALARLARRRRPA